MFALETQLELEKKDNVVRDLHVALRSSLTKEHWQTFDDQKTDRGRIKVLLELAKQQILTCVDKKAKQHPVAKDKSKSMTLKEAGNKAFGAGNNQLALQTYSECLSWMPHDETKDAAVVYANRSASLFHLEEFALAIQDAEIAFSLNYPPELHYKLYERAGRCCLQLGNRAEAAKHFQLGLKTLANAKGLDESKTSKIKTTLENLLRACPSNSSSNNKPEEGMSLPDLAGGRGKYLRNASKRVAIRRNEVEGRFVVATEDIRPGDVVFVEKAYVSTLAQEFCHKQCHQCFTLIQAPVVCTNCITVSYCSPKCRDIAWATHHRYECQILGFLHRSGISIICYMAIRILTQGNPVSVLSWYNLANETEELERKNHESGGENKGSIVDKEVDSKKRKGNVNEEVQPEGEYRTDHVALFQLVSHSSDRSTEDNFHRAVMALYLLFALKRTHLFKDIVEKKKAESSKENKSKNKNKRTSTSIQEEVTEEVLEQILGTLIFRSLKFLQFNTHEIAGWDVEKEKSVYLGGGLFNTLALCNHSCAPSLVRYFFNDTVVVRAIRIIRRGEQVTENYGQSYADTAKEVRQKALWNIFRFNCMCYACKLDWPTFSEMTTDSMTFRCSFCLRFLVKTTPENMGFIFGCPFCSKQTNVLKSLKLLHDGESKYKQAMDFMKKGQINTALGIINEILVLYDTILIPPFKDYHYSQDAIRFCYLSMGNKAKRPDFLDVIGKE